MIFRQSLADAGREEETLGYELRDGDELNALTLDVLKSTEIEGEILDPQQVRSSLARRLGIEIPGMVYSELDVEGVVEMMLDAVKFFEKPLTTERLLNWQASLFPTGRSGGMMLMDRCK